MNFKITLLFSKQSNVSPLCGSLLQKISLAYNSGIRAIFRLPKKGYAPINDLCARIQIPTIDQIKEELLLMEAWKRRSCFTIPTEGPTTRGRANLNVPLPNMKGMSGKLLNNILCEYWNKLPLATKLETNTKKAKLIIRRQALNLK